MNTTLRSVVTALFVFGWLAAGNTQAERAGSQSPPCAKKKAKDDAGFKPLFDGKSLTGWEGDKKLWLVENGMLIGRSPGIKGNVFLCTKQSFEDFELRVTFRLLGGKGNSGFQFRSKKVPGHVSGYQADAGQKYWGCLYDEARRRKILVKAPPKVKDHYKPDGWNKYVIRCQGPEITMQLNGFTTVKYTERDAKIPRKGIIAPQLHGGPPMEIQIKDIRIKTLPAK